MLHPGLQSRARGRQRGGVGNTSLGALNPTAQACSIVFLAGDGRLFTAVDCLIVLLVFFF